MESRGKFRFWDFDLKKHIYSDEVLQMSASVISDCEVCDYKFYHKLTQEVKFPKNVYLIMGSVFHCVIEQDLRYKVKYGINQKQEIISTYFESAWAKEKQGCNFNGKIKENEAKLKCENYIHIYSFKMSPMLYPLNNESIEKFFRVHIAFGEKRLGITGKVDMIGKDLWITDHKTSSSIWTQKEADEEIQAQLYPYCMKNLGYDIQGFKFNVVSGVVVNVLPVIYNQVKVKDILMQAFQIKERIELGEDFMLKSKSEKVCHFCDFKNMCKYSLIKKEGN